MSKAICLIPARGGSKRIPGKNMRPFLGVPILQRVIGHAKSWGGFGEIWVSSDSTEILDFAVRCEALPEIRPEGLANDDTWLEPVLADFIQRHPSDWFCMLLATGVFARPAIIQASYGWRGRRPVVTISMETGKDAGQLYWIKTDDFLSKWENGLELLDQSIVEYPIHAVDINIEDDWQKAEAMFGGAD